MRHLSLECRFEAWFLDFRRKVQGKWKGKGKGIGKSFLCPKCGIYLLNAALKRDLSISEGKYKGKMQRQRQMHRKMVFMPYLLNAAFISWMPLWSVNFSISECKYKGKMQMQRQMRHRKIDFLCKGHKCPKWHLSLEWFFRFEAWFVSISEGKYKGKM